MLRASDVIFLVRHTKETKLDVRGKAKLEANDKHALLSALISNFHLECFVPANKYFNKDESKELKKAFARNRLLSAEKQYQNFLIDYFEQQPIAEANQSITNVLEMIEKYRTQFQEVRDAMAPYACEKRMAKLKRRMDVLMTYASAWLKHNQQFEMAVRCYLDISAQSNKHIPARFAAFEIAYSCHYDEEHPQPFLTAFLGALKYSLDDAGRIPLFEDKKQSIFDRYLCQAANIKIMLGDVKILDEDTRKFLLYFVLKSGMFHQLTRESYACALFQTRDDRLKRQYLALPKFASVDDVKQLSADEKTMFSVLWNKMTAALPSLEDDSLMVLFKAAIKDKKQDGEVHLALRRSHSQA